MFTVRWRLNQIWEWAGDIEDWKGDRKWEKELETGVNNNWIWIIRNIPSAKKWLLWLRVDEVFRAELYCSK